MEETLKHLNFIQERSFEIINNYNNENVGRISFFYLGLLERLNAVAIGLHRLLTDLEKQPALEFSAGLVIRTALLDFLIGLRGHDLYHQEKQKGSNQDAILIEVEQYCNSVLADGLTHALRHFTSFHKEGAISEQQRNDVYRNMANKYTAFLNTYNEDGKAPTSRYKSAQSASGLFQSLSKGDKSMKALARNYETYAFY